MNKDKKYCVINSNCYKNNDDVNYQMLLHSLGSTKFPVFVSGKLELEKSGSQSLPEQHLRVVGSKIKKQYTV